MYVIFVDNLVAFQGILSSMAGALTLTVATSASLPVGQSRHFVYAALRLHFLAGHPVECFAQPYR